LAAIVAPFCSLAAGILLLAFARRIARRICSAAGPATHTP
jgi:hypothetical protein